MMSVGVKTGPSAVRRMIWLQGFALSMLQDHNRAAVIASAPAVWYMDGAVRTSAEYLTPSAVDPSWQIVAP